MGRFDLEIDVDTKQVSKRLQDAIEDGIEDSLDEIADGAQHVAEGKIIQENAIWREILLRSFETNSFKYNDSWYIKLINWSDHAIYVEEGAEYGAKGPPVEALIPWVRDNLGGWIIDSDGKLVPKMVTDGGYERTPSNTQSLNTDGGLVDTTNIQDALQTGGGVESDTTYVLEFENGDRAIFKQDGNPETFDGSTKNEAAYSRVTDVLGWETGPEAQRFDHPELGEGTALAFVENADGAGDIIDTEQNPMGFEPVGDYLDDNIDQLAKIGLMDYLMGNGDRHLSNVLLDQDYNVHAIDNGGFGSPLKNNGLDTNAPGVHSIFAEGDKYDVGDGLKAILERQEVLVEEIRENRSNIFREFVSIHDIDSDLSKRMEALLFNESGVWGDGESWQFPGIYAMLEDEHDLWLSKLDASTDPDKSDVDIGDDLSIVQSLEDDMQDMFGNL